MIAAPLNDQECLQPTTDFILAEIEAGNPALVDLANRFDNTNSLAAWFRTLPQRDDHSLPSEGPKVTACRPAQRLQLDNPEPNCFERAARFVGAAELIDPVPVYRLATVSTPNGLHTFPTRDGKPVVLDPKVVRNASSSSCGVDIGTRRLRLQRLIGLDETKGLRGDLARALRAKDLGHTTWVDNKPIDTAIATYEKALASFQAQLDALSSEDGPRNSGGPIVLTPREAIDWIAELAMTRADRMVGGTRRIENGHRAMRGVLAFRPICVSDIRDVALVLALAEREARSEGLGALRIVHSTARAIDSLDQLAATRLNAPARNLSLADFALGLFGDKDIQQLVGGLTRVAGRIAGNLGLEAAQGALASVGVSQPVIAAFERELNREGLSLGPLAKPAPMLGSLNAMTPEALARRRLVSKV